MSQLREFAQHKSEFDHRSVRLLAVSVDDTAHARRVWRKVVNRQFSVLSDPGAQTIRKYGLLHAGGDDGKSEDIAIRTTLLIDETGRELWRRVSPSAYNIAHVREVLERIDGKP
jgi:peroxiredoxin